MSFHLFERFGVEIEYMIVEAESLKVLPISDQLLRAASGGNESEIEVGNSGWSNELVLHVLEFKTKAPAESLTPIAADFQSAVSHANHLLQALGGQLLPTAMHPWMDPARDTRLWPHDNSEIYGLFNRIFDCRGHGWSNLQSVHINLPFSGDAEFERLHAAIRLVLPLLPMLSASSPFVEGRLTGTLDNRLAFYRNNCARVPCITAQVIPESVATEAEYRSRILDPIGAAIRPFDPENVLDPEWVNARGAITRFSRGSIEIRLLDVQECPLVDMAIVHAVVGLVRSLVEERSASLELQCSFHESRLLRLFEAGVEHGSQAVLDDPEYLQALGVNMQQLTASSAWFNLLSNLVKQDLVPPQQAATLEVILQEGTLAERIVRRIQASSANDSPLAVYQELGRCLAENRPFSARS